MTTVEWNECTTKPAMMYRRVASSLSARKLQLLACAQSRLLPLDALEPWALQAIETAEAFAEGELPAAEFHQVAERVRQACDDLEMRQAVHGDVPEEAISAATTVLCCTGMASLVKSIPALMEHVQRYDQLTTPRGLKLKSRAMLLSRQCHLVREITPYPVTDYKRLLGKQPAVEFADGKTFEITETARSIAISTHTDQAFDRLPILADALEDAGCPDEGLLHHLRHGEHHIRGCWALDLILGRG
ncbi:hypothetical protein BH11PLA2_BH11PLA2_27420 [soil metagenome]